MKKLCAIAFCLVLVASGSAWAQEAVPVPAPEATDTSAATGATDTNGAAGVGAGSEAQPQLVPEPVTPPPAEEFYATVSELEGTADVQLADESWIAAEVGTRILPGSTVFSGYNSEVSLEFSNYLIVVLRPLSELNILTFQKNAQTYITDLKLGTGELRFKVLEGDYKTDMRVATPNATASVTGTEVRQISTSPDRGDQFWVEEGSVALESRGRTLNLAAGEQTTQDLLRAIEAARMERVVDLTPAGTTSQELVAALLSTEPTSILPGDLNNDEGNPGRRRVIEGQNPERLAEARARSTDEPPP